MSLLEGRYKVEREIARGGMGRVFRAYDERLRRPVAIKTLHDRAGQSLQLRFVEEAQITGQLRHPHVVPVHELSCAGDELFLAMQLIQGRELKDLVKELAADTSGHTRRAYPVSRRLRLFLQICEAIAYAHEHGVIHRDLKPQNVMLDAGDAVLVMDWGVARPVRSAESSALEHSVDSILRSNDDDEDDDSGQVTQRGAVIGTPAYMPLEQAEGDPTIDFRADVYALGSILYELLTFIPPDSGKATPVLRALFKGPPPPPRERAPELEIPAAVEAIALRAMARDRDARYPTAAALAADVRAYLDDRAIGAYDEGLRETLGRLWRRHGRALRSAAAALVLIAIAWVGAIVAARTAAANAREQRQVAEEARLEAEGLADEARRSMAAQRAGAQASEWIRGAYEVQVEFVQRAAEIRVIETLRKDLAETLAALRGVEDQLQALATEGSLADAAPFLELLADARQRAQRRGIDVLLARAPSVLLEVASELELELTPIDRARVELRLGDRRAAAKRLQDSPASAARDALLAVTQDLDPALRISALEAAMNAHPRAAWPYLHRAEAHLWNGSLELAEQDYLRAKILDPLDGWVLLSQLRWATSPYSNTYLLGNVQRVIAGENARVEGERFRAGGLARELAPRIRAIIALVGAGSKFGRKSWRGVNDKGKPNGLAVRFERQRSQGKLPEAFFWQVMAEGALHYATPAEARDVAEAALAAFPDDRLSAGFLAQAELALENLDAAASAARAGLEGYPWDPRLNFVLGEVLRRRGDFSAAAPHLRLGVNGWLLSDRWELLARCLSELDDPQAWVEGVAAARGSLARDPFLENHVSPDFEPGGLNPQPHRTLAALRVKQGKPLLGALHLVRARILSTLKPVVEREGLTERDSKALAELHESLDMYPAASVYWRQTMRDPTLAEEAKRRLAECEAHFRK